MPPRTTWDSRGMRMVPHSGRVGGKSSVEVINDADSLCTGWKIAGTRALADLNEALDTVMIAGGPEAALRNVGTSTGLVDWIAQRAPDTRRVASVSKVKVTSGKMVGSGRKVTVVPRVRTAPLGMGPTVRRGRMTRPRSNPMW